MACRVKGERVRTGPSAYPAKGRNRRQPCSRARRTHTRCRCEMADNHKCLRVHLRRDWHSCRIDRPSFSRYNALVRCRLSPRCTVHGEMEPKILLLIARAQSVVKHLQSALDASRYVLRWAPNTRQALELDLVPSLLVLELPSSGGKRSIARLKDRFQVPVLVLARKGQDGVAHADAVVLRPYQLEEFVDLIDATLINHAANIVCGDSMSLDTVERRLQVNGVAYRLRPLACRILALLMERSGQVVSREELFRRVWRTTERDSTRALDVHLAYLRQKLEADPSNPRLIVTERGVGYRLHPPS